MLMPATTATRATRGRRSALVLVTVGEGKEVESCMIHFGFELQKSKSDTIVTFVTLLTFNMFLRCTGVCDDDIDIYYNFTHNSTMMGF